MRTLVCPWGWLRAGHTLFWSLALLCCCAVVTPVQAQDDEEDEDLKRPGVVARYQVLPQGPVVGPQVDSLPTLLLKPTEAPDPRLPVSGWKATWSGVLEVLRPGKHQFAVQSTGPVQVRIAGQEVLNLAAATERQESKEVDLKFGLQPLEVSFTANTPGATLRLFWRGESFPWEPLPASAVGHTKAQSLKQTPLLVGHLAVEEHSCVACHAASDKLPMSQHLLKRPGPHLTDAGSRLKKDWIAAWLGDPQAIRPEAVMPKLFTNDRRGEIERYAVADYLSSLGEPLAIRTPEEDAKLQARVAQGQELFVATGCAVCHTAQPGHPARATLQGLRHKSEPAAIARFLKDPLAHDPAGRMPQFQLTQADADVLAEYVAQLNPPARAPAAPNAPLPHELRDLLLGPNPTAADAVKFSSEPIAKQLGRLAQQVLKERQCANCHDLKTPGAEGWFQKQPAKHDLAQVAAAPKGGCLDANNKTGAPRFGASLNVPAVQSFLASTVGAPGTPAPAVLASLNLERFNCTGCHKRNGGGGLLPGMVAELQKNQTEQAAEAIQPPTLTGVTGKLLGPALHGVLVDGKRARPWMGLQMPQFPKAELVALPAQLAALDGEPLVDSAVQPAKDAALAEAGRKLVGSTGFGCTKCHDILGINSGGTRGPDLSKVTDRVRSDWYHRWMLDPQRIEPGTRMPTVFLNGQSPLPQILGGDVQKQREAMWQYFLASSTLPLPEGVKQTAVTEVATTSEKPTIVRSFLPNVSARGVAIRFPTGVHLVFDAQSCRLAYGWSGDFIDMGPVWTARGGQIAPLKGPLFWTSPAGFPWDVTGTPSSVPSFAGRGKDPIWGAPTPQDGKLYTTKVNFKGYRTLGAVPAFRYALTLEDASEATFEEQFTTFDTATARGVLRQTQIQVPQGKTVWQQVAVSDLAPAWRASAGQKGFLETAEQQAPADAVVKVMQGGKLLVLHLRQSPSNAQWRVEKQEGKWSVMVCLPEVPRDATLGVMLWAPKETDSATVEAIVQEEQKNR